jgi:hypothetical protein
MGFVGDVIDGDGSSSAQCVPLFSGSAGGLYVAGHAHRTRRFGSLPLKFLILGAVTPEQQDEALDELRIACGRDAWRPSRTTPFELPTASSSIVVIDQVADLSTDDQQTLLQWIDTHRDAMVLSFGTNAMFRMVTNGKFSASLYYRLNIITLSVDDEAA